MPANVNVSSVVRSLAFTAFQLVVTPLYAALMLLTCWLPRIGRYRVAASWCSTNLGAARSICGIRTRALGLENIPRGPDSRPHIVMSKHSSTWETLALTRYFPPLAYVAKKELLSIPFFGWGFALASPITIDRSAGTGAMQQIATQGRERFAQGFWIAIYPEGTRIRAGTRAKYKTGGARLAIELGVPVLPVAHNAGYLWPKGTFGKRAGTVTISFGPPISSAGKDPQSLTTEVETWIENEVSRLSEPR
ncbi:MAG: 1-acyl-sn-glycerol-3-phosphate acyltransferase [Pseudomonadota bacterium]|nr:1-acyl-sn-glycerol-3-phosphate acyltransferase [Pseudomonadota bacterium]